VVRSTIPSCSLLASPSDTMGERGRAASSVRREAQSPSLAKFPKPECRPSRAEALGWARKALQRREAEWESSRNSDNQKRSVPSPRGAGRGTALLRARGWGVLPWARGAGLCRLPLPTLRPARNQQKCCFSAGFVLLSRKRVCVVSWFTKHSAFYCSLALA